MTRSLEDELFYYSNLFSELNTNDERRIHYPKYLQILRRLAYSGNAIAQFELGQHYDEINYLGVNENCDKKKAFYWYSKACESNISDACNEIAIMYELGEVVSKDLSKAVFFYKKAIDLGLSIAKDNLDDLYIKSKSND